MQFLKKKLILERTALKPKFSNSFSSSMANSHNDNDVCVILFLGNNGSGANILTVQDC